MYLDLNYMKCSNWSVNFIDYSGDFQDLGETALEMEVDLNNTHHWYDNYFLSQEIISKDGQTTYRIEKLKVPEE